MQSPSPTPAPRRPPPPAHVIARGARHGRSRVSRGDDAEPLVHPRLLDHPLHLVSDRDQLVTLARLYRYVADLHASPLKRRAPRATRRRCPVQGRPPHPPHPAATFPSSPVRPGGQPSSPRPRPLPRRPRPSPPPPPRARE